MRKLELLAPGGDIESIKAAIVAGADAVYCGLNSFNARTRAENLSFEDLYGLLRIAHQHNCQLFLTLNIIVLEQELPALLKLLNQLVNTGIDGVIVQDFGLFYLLKQHYPSLDIHASTQVTTHNSGQLEFLSKLGASRVNLSRELNLEEIKLMSDKAHSLDMLTEVFVHGSNCIGFSGLCYFSSAHGGNSGNRGRCSQPCRDQYQTTDVGAQYPLNLKDNSAYSDLDALYAAGADSLKVEGRIKKSHYVYRVIDTWRKQITRLEQNQAMSNDKNPLYTVFNRDFSNGYLQGAVGKNMYIDNPRDNAVQHFTRIESLKPVSGENSEGGLNVKKALYDEKTEIIETLAGKIAKLSLDKPIVSLRFSGQQDQALRISVELQVNNLKGKHSSFEVKSSSVLLPSDKYGLQTDELTKRFASIGGLEFSLEPICYDELADNLFVPFKELTEMKRQIVCWLNDGREHVEPLTLQAVRKQVTQETKAANAQANLGKHTGVSILIANRRELALYREIKQSFNGKDVSVYYAIPDAIEAEREKLSLLFTQEPELIPWFGAVIMEPDFIAAKQLLSDIQPKIIVSNNSGVGIAANQHGIEWIAGPYLNISNSLSMHSLQQQGCVGAFVSNELNKQQIKTIKAPSNFKVHYSLYHPVMLMSSRQCLFLQSCGCDKAIMDKECLTVCKKTSSLTNVKGIDFVIDKKRREHNALYGSEHFYNPQVLSELKGYFDSVLLDLRAVATKSQLQQSPFDTVAMFVESLSQQPLDGAAVQSSQGQRQVLNTSGTELSGNLQGLIVNTTNEQYRKGL
ncbi:MULTISPECIES: peptidase U32 family protein [unclassified Shewanella]|uniref:peptidase U32 family protein n=1 Tax=unclassified Shewanella TaxID=196818 RepID=UPI001BC3034F|nr:MULTISPECIES: peptidase U32 family protein [unclassified Shewanella]GIU10696.1 peptidase U32 [Shewanella sp. MBTL60-112-B1]GIU32816.1 peptidase U32 [Shewanella sp. MBTL60-112-B2]